MKSRTRKSDGSCPSGFHPRKAYTLKGRHIPAGCIRATSLEPRSNFIKATRRRMSRRLQGVRKSRRGATSCPTGKILRDPYVRVRNGKKIFVPASCIADVGNPGKGLIAGKGIGPLRQGDLAKFGYSSVVSLSEGRRHLALAQAVREYGSLTVWRKLNAVYIYTRHTSPASSAIFMVDRDWVRATYGIKAF